MYEITCVTKQGALMALNEDRLADALRLWRSCFAHGTPRLWFAGRLIK